MNGFITAGLTIASRKLACCAFAIGLAGFISGAIPPVAAGEVGYCKDWATLAVARAKEVRAMGGCGIDPNDIAMSTNWSERFSWCISVQQETADATRLAYAQTIGKCAYCNSYADTIVALGVDNITFRCGLTNPDGRWTLSRASQVKACMALQYNRGGYLWSRHVENDADAAKKLLEPALAEMARQIMECRKSHTNPPVCKTCHSSQAPTAFTPSAVHPGPKRVSTDPTIARQPPAFTPVPERRRTPRDTGRGTSSGGSDQVAPRGAPAGGSGSAMDRLGGSGSSSPSSGGSGSGGGSAGRPSGASGGAASGASPSANNPAPNINSNTIMKQAPAFGQTPGLR